MQYKGEDLDLRVPTRSGRDLREPAADFDPASNGRWQRPLWSAPHEPIWVDEIVLQCCNYAFDIAVAHAAPEVGLEHLVHALTRVDASARILETRGVREAQLRRESAALLASEIPTTQSGDRSAPRRSPDMEDVLRRATEVAGRRGHAATVDDVLWTILNYGRDLAAVALLRRMTPDWQRPGWGRDSAQPTPTPVPEPAPPRVVVQERVVQERVVPVVQESVLPRITAIEDGIRAVLAEMAAERKAASQRIGGLEDGLRALHAELANERRSNVAPRIATIEDGVRALHAELTGERRANVVPRIAAIEDGVRALHAEIGGERKAVAELIRDIQRDVVAQRGDQAAFRGDLGQRLETLERSLQVRGDATRIPAQMADRMQALEKAVHGGLGEGARNWAALGQRLQALEAAVQQRPAEGGEPAPLLLQRLAALESTQEARATQVQRGLETFVERLAALERIAAAGAGEGGRHWAALSERIGTIETLLKSRAGEHPELGGLLDRLGGLERAVRSGFGDAARLSGELRERVLGLERMAASAPASASDEAALLLEDRLGAIERTVAQRMDRVDTRLKDGDSLGTEIVERVRAIEGRVATAGGQRIDADSLVEPLARRLAQVNGQSAERTSELALLIRQTSERLAQLETVTRSLHTAGDAAVGSRDQELQQINATIAGLAANQSDLASGIANWRHEVLTDLGAINGRLDLLAATMPVEVPRLQPPALQPEPEVAVHTRIVPRETAVPRTEPLVDVERPVAGDQIVEPTRRRRGFWYWLFGTGSIGNANRDAGMRFERLQQQIRDARERRRGEA